MTRIKLAAEETAGASRSGGEDCEGVDLVQELASCSAQLGAFCWDGSESEDEGTDDDCSSAADIASECLALLESLSVVGGCEDDSTAEAADEEEPPLLRELGELGDDLQTLITLLCPPVDVTAEKTPDVAPETIESSVLSPCTSPKMVALTKRLESRPATMRMRVHTALQRHKPFPLNIKSPLKREGKAQSATHALLNDANFWRQYQSKSLHRHLQRQTQARTIQQQQQDKVNKAIEYRYRRVAKPCYPLAKNKSRQQDLDAASPVEKVTLPGVPDKRPKRSYSTQFSRQKESNSTVPPDGLLCGVYLYGKRRSHGMLYLTCASLEQLKTRIASKFSLSQPVVNLYREQIATYGPSQRERKYLHRVSRFHELQNGDLLCATTDGYEDMAILCAWMKKRQEMIHHIDATQASRKAVETTRECTTANAKKSKSKTQEDSAGLTYKPPPAPSQPKLWDENGRLMSIPNRLPLAD